MGHAKSILWLAAKDPGGDVLSGHGPVEDIFEHRTARRSPSSAVYFFQNIGGQIESMLNNLWQCDPYARSVQRLRRYTAKSRPRIHQANKLNAVTVLFYWLNRKAVYACLKGVNDSHPDSANVADMAGAELLPRLAGRVPAKVRESRCDQH